MSRISPVRRVRAVLVASLFIPVSASARKTCTEVLAASQRLSDALQRRDTVRIKTLVDADIAYGHSNGWIESRPDMLRDLYDGTLSYGAIRLLDTPGCAHHGRVATVRHRVAVDIRMNGAKLQMNLAVLQVWRSYHNRWMLIARQAGKIP